MIAVLWCSALLIALGAVFATASLYSPNWRWLVPAVAALVSGLAFLVIGLLG